MNIIPQSINLMHGGDNDRTEGIHLDGVDPRSSYLNIYWSHGRSKCYTHEQKVKANIRSFDVVEKKFYHQHFHEYVKTIIKSTEDYWKSTASCPVEFIFKYDPSISLETALNLFCNLPAVLAKQSETKRGVRRAFILDWALHLDEPAVGPHVHMRIIWVAHTKVKSGLSLLHASFGMDVIHYKPKLGRPNSYRDYIGLLVSCSDKIFDLSCGKVCAQEDSEVSFDIEPLSSFMSASLIASLSKRLLVASR